MDRVYFDHNATTTLRPEAREAMLAAMGITGNASSVHGEGRRARRMIEQAREKIAALVHVRPGDVVFTSSATEAANAVLTPDAPRQQNPAPLTRLLVGASEHPAVLQGHRFPAERVEPIPVDGAGRINPEALAVRVADLAREHGVASVAVAIQAANNETGVIQPLAEIEGRIRGSGAMIIVDAAQFAGKLPFGASFRADALILSSHKLGGPLGAGAIAYGGDHFRPEPLLRGGGQEGRRRAGTENVAAIVGFAVAAEAAFAEAERFATRTRILRDKLEQFLRHRHPNLVVFGEGAERLPNTSCFAVPGLAAETLLIALDLAGVAVSSGSACSSGKVAPSHVLAAMGVPASLAKGAIRVSLGWDSAESDLDSFATAWRSVLDHVAPEEIQAA